MPLKILKHFDQLVVVLKPSGVLSVPARDAKDERAVLGKMLEAELKTQIYPVHRLDFEVSGIMLYALSAPMHKLLSTCFENHTIEKTYHAFAQKHADNFSQQTWKSLLLKGKKRTYEAPYGKPSTTFATCLKNINHQQHPLSYWELKPKTGRSHQLRYEMMKHGHTIVGDKLYGSEIDFKAQSIALCSTKIHLPLSCQAAPWHLPAELSLTPEEIDQLLIIKA